MLIYGNGQIAKEFKKCNIDNLTIFASGVSNSRCEDKTEFSRERNLLLKALEESPLESLFVYFSSAALSLGQGEVNDYYTHKLSMEYIIKSSGKRFLILRIPQLFAGYKKHPTLINYLIEKVLKEEMFDLQTKATRYLVDVKDIVAFTKYFHSCESEFNNRILDFANPYCYEIKEIVSDIERIYSKKARYNEVNEGMQYNLDLDYLNDLDIFSDFGRNYFYERLNTYNEI
ncbi:NAD(P)-dependent oxidoreductase [Salinimonas lutimaris]|uniref:NAD(P)-dependent oxidoreductase n=1 Tax=Salinimonas lutimaris TaxID=914153 RepID=UPI0010C0C4D2|nr:NAD(P)-dependent oxidoreductase [Salinimonas lutimaris]